MFLIVALLPATGDRISGSSGLFPASDLESAGCPWGPGVSPRVPLPPGFFRGSVQEIRVGGIFCF